MAVAAENLPRAGKRELSPDAVLIQTVDSMFQSPEYLVALETAKSAPFGSPERKLLDEEGEVRVEKNGSVWGFKSRMESRAVTRTTIHRRLVNDLVSQQGFDNIEVEIDTRDSVIVNSEEYSWKREPFSYYDNAGELGKDFKWSGRSPQEARQKIMEFVADYNAPEAVQSQASLEKVVFITDNGRLSPKSEFVSPNDMLDRAVSQLRANEEIFPYGEEGVRVIREEGERPYIYIITHELLSYAELEALITSVDGVEVKVSKWQYPFYEEERRDHAARSAQAEKVE